MLKKIDPKLALVCVFVLMNVLPESVFAAADSAISLKKLDANAFTTEVDQLRGFLFGSVTKAIAACGAFYGFLKAYMSSSVTPLLIFGGIGIAVIFMDKFLNLVF